MTSPSLPTNALGIMLLLGSGLAILFKRWKSEIFGVLLEWLHQIRRADGYTIGGPKWQWNSGQMTDKFLFGRQKSFEWEKAHGSIYRIWSGVRPEIVITKSEDVREFYRSSQAHSKARSSNGGWFFHQLLGDCLGLINGQRWAHLRELLGPHFSLTSSRVRLLATMTSAEEYVEQLQSMNGNPEAASTFQVRVVDALQAFPFYHTAEIIYGELDRGQKEELWSLGQQRAALLNFVLQGGIYRSSISKWLDPQMYKKLQAFREAWFSFNAEVFRARSQQPCNGLLERIWPLVSRGELSTDQTLQTFDEMLFANLDVTNHVLSWIFTLLADSESVQQKLREEILHQESKISSYLQRKDTYLHMCWLETLRVRPVAAFTIPESSSDDIAVGGVRVPANTDVIVDTIALHLRNSFWGSDTSAFRPERFKNIKQTELRYNLSTFGFGARKCLGQYEADISIKALTVQLLLQYEISVASGKGYQEGAFQVVRDNWVPLADVELVLERR